MNRARTLFPSSNPSQDARTVSISQRITESSESFESSLDRQPPLSQPDHQSLESLYSEQLHTYVDAQPPNLAQLRYANTFFTAGAPQILYSAAAFRNLPPSAFPEVAFLGRSNVGKSSLLNALFGRPKSKPAHVSSRPGRTRSMNGFGVSGGLAWGEAKTKDKSNEKDKATLWRAFPRGGLVVLDMPGYGAGSREEWGKEIMKVLSQRKQLRRTFVLVDAEHGLKSTDLDLLTYLRRQGLGFQVVLSKADKVMRIGGSRHPTPQRIANGLVELAGVRDAVRKKLDEAAGDGRSAVGDILCCSAEQSLEETGHRRAGIDAVRWAVLRACGMESDTSGQRKVLQMQHYEVGDDSSDLEHWKPERGPAQAARSSRTRR